MKGFRDNASASKKDQFRTMQTEMENLNMANRISQMMIQQLVQSNRNQGEDLNRLMNLVNELQYKLLAMQQTGPFEIAKLSEIANSMRLKDFNEASDTQDKQGNFQVADIVGENSTVLLTSTTATNGEEDKGIFRSHVKLSDCGVPELISGLAGQPVGTKVTVTLNGQAHVVELLGVRNPTVVIPEVVPEAGIS